MNRIKKKESHFVTVANALLRDNRISFKAKGLFCYMYSMSEDWNFTLRGIATQQKDGLESVTSAMNELKNFKYVVYEKSTDGTGIYHLDDEPNNIVVNPIVKPNTENQDLAQNPIVKPNTENPNQAFPMLGKPVCIKNKKLIQNKKEKEKKEEEEEGSSSKLYSKFFNEFYSWLKMEGLKPRASERLHKKAIFRNLLTEDEKTVENFKDFLLDKEEQFKTFENQVVRFDTDNEYMVKEVEVSFESESFRMYLTNGVRTNYFPFQDFEKIRNCIIHSS